MEITTGANVDSRIRGLDTGEVELRTWWGADGSSSVQMHSSSYHPPALCKDRTPAGQGQACVSLPTGVGATGTLMSLLGATRQRPSVLTRPVEVVGWAPTDLAPQGVGATLGHNAPSWLYLDYQRGLVCWWGKRGTGKLIQVGGPPHVALSQYLYLSKDWPTPFPALSPRPSTSQTP